MPNNFLQCSQAEKFAKTLQEYQKKGMLKIDQNNRKKKNQNQIFVDLKNVWHTNTINQQKQYEAIRKSPIFAQDRKLTFLKFNYRNVQSKDLCHDNVYSRILGKKTQRTQSQKKMFSRGTMNVSELWSQKMLNQVLGNLPFPRDRLKVLKMYSRNRSKLSLNKSQRLATE